jgi:hypothetical protein
MTLIAMSDVSLLTIPQFAIGAAIWAEAIGVPVAWLKLRHTDVWKNRSPGVRSIDLLSGFVFKITALSALWGALLAVSMIVVSA